MRDILFLAHRVPYPPDRGDKIRSFHVLKHLAQHARVHLIGFADDARDLSRKNALAPYTVSRTVLLRRKGKLRAAAEALLMREPASVAAFADDRLQAAVDALLADTPIDAIYVFSGQMAQYAPVDGPPVIMDFVDMDSAKFAQYADDAKGPMRWLMRREARLLQRFELAVAERAQTSLFVSQAEADLFADRTGFGRAQVIENGIDTVRFDPAVRHDPVASGGPLIVFTGQMDYRPNIDAVDMFAREVMPAIARTRPEARFAIVGRNPAEPVRALASLPNVTVTGEVADVQGWLAAADVVVAPLMLARGIQNKVLEAMAMARPVVASAAAAKGIDHRGTVRVAGDGPAFAAQVIDLLDDPAAAAALGRAARQQVIVRYGWDAALAPLEALIGIAPERVAA